MTGRAAAFALEIAEIGELEAEDYVGLIDETAVECLKARLAIEGLLTPIWVRRNGNAAKARWSVIAGRHRLLAAKRLGWTEITAEQRAGDTSRRPELRALQVAENLDRRTLRPIEYALFVMDRWKLEEGRASLDTMSKATIDDNTALACGIETARTVRRYRRIYDCIVDQLPNHFAELNAHPLGESFKVINSLASERSLNARRDTVEMILSKPDWQSIDEVMVALGRPSTGNRVDPTHPDATFWNSFRGMPRLRREKALRQLSNEVTPREALEFIAGLKERNLIRDDIAIA